MNPFINRKDRREMIELLNNAKKKKKCGIGYLIYYAFQYR